jgi:hypothetical protein
MVPLNPVEKKARIPAASLEQSPAAARTQVIATELFGEFLVPVDDPVTPLDVGFAQAAI